MPVSNAMYVLFRLLIIILICHVSRAQAQTRSILIKDISIIPMNRDTVLPHRDVWVRHGLITRIAPHHRAAKADTIISGRGKFLLPGFTDCHVHYKNTPQLFAAYDSLYLRYGVTGLLALNGTPELLRHRDSIRRGIITGPEIQCSGPAVNDSTMTPATATTLLQQLQKAGYDFVKIYSDLSKAGFETISRDAGAYGLRIVGHIPQRVTTMGVLHGRQELIAHAEEFLYNPPVNYMMGNITTPALPDTALINPLADSVAAFKKAVSPTLITFHAILHTALDPEQYPKQSPLPLTHPIAAFWKWDDSWIPRKFIAPLSIQRLQAAFDYQLQLVRAFRDKKVLLLAGTDAPTMPALTPGHALHLELQLLHRAGLTAFEALQAATINAARFLKTEQRLGTVEEGKEATLVILDKNPLEAIANTLSVNRVLLRGELMP